MSNTQETQLPFSELLKKAAAKDTISVWIPSQKQHLPFKPMSTKHQKMLTKACFNPKDLQTTVYEIILELNPSVSQLTTMDLHNILLSLRAECISPVITVGKTEVDIKQLLERNEKQVFDNEPKVVSWTKGDVVYNFKLSAPNLSLDYAMNKHIKTFFGIQGDKEEIASTTLAEMVQGQLASYIREIEVVIDGKPASINMSSFRTIKEKLAVIEELPSAALSDIFGTIKEYVAFADSFLAYEGGKIKLDENFFIVAQGK